MGPVEVKGEQDEAGVCSLSVKAFGREVILSKARLAELEGRLLNGIKVSYERGWAKTGGRAIYVMLVFGGTGGSDRRSMVVIRESGELSIKRMEEATGSGESMKKQLGSPRIVKECWNCGEVF